MPRKQKPPRLWLKPAERGRPAVWLIKDGSRRYSTAALEDDIQGAERALALHIATKAAQRASEARQQDPGRVTCAEVLLGYWEAKGEQSSRPDQLQAQIARLNEFFGDKFVGSISQAMCREYVEHRGVNRSAAHELAYLKAAINLAAKERKILFPVPIWMPPASQPRERWLTRDEMAHLLWAAWRYRETQRGSPGRYTRRHVAVFILMARYTGSRSGAILSASFDKLPGRGWIDLANGLYYRAAPDEAGTKKRKPPIRLPLPLLAHLRRWRARRPHTVHVIEWNGQPVTSIKRAFASVRSSTELDDDVTPHVLRHTAVTWAMQSGADRWEVAGFFGLTMQMIEQVYGHHSPDSGGTVHRALSAKRSAKRSATPDLKIINN